jgi:bifunctional DNase/RNase
MIKMEVLGVQQVLPSNTPVVLLREEDGERLLPIFIGLPEATAIGLALSGQEPPRPMTHDLMAGVLETFSIALEQVVVSELRDRTFFAEIYLRGPVGVEAVSARPSDAIALAVRTGAAVFVADEVLDEAGYVAPSSDEAPMADAQVEEFRAFLDTVNPDDFAGE